jgi:hypothetical protein
MKVAELKIGVEGVKVSPEVKPIAYAIDTEYLESKFVDFFEVSHNGEQLRKTRRDFVERVRDKIKNSMPSSALYLSGPAKPNNSDQYIVFVPVLRIMADEKDGFVNANCDITVRIYGRGGTRTSSLKASDSVSIKYAGHYSFIGTIEYYKTFMWENALLAKIEEAQNQALDKSLKGVLEQLSKWSWRNG